MPLVGRRPAPMDMDFCAAIAAGRVLVARDAGGEGPVGYVVIHPPSGGAAFLEAVAVRPERQGRGIGRRLIGAAEDEARRAGAECVRLYTNAAMRANLTLYPRLGYRETGRRIEDGFERVHFEKVVPPPVVIRRSVERLFGRRSVHGHRLGPQYAHYAIDPSAPFPGAAALFGRPIRAIRLEVGFGAGEHLLHHAREAPGVGIVGVEPFETGMMRAVRDLAAEGLANVRLYHGDARDVLDWLPDESLDRVDILYPDPWPKRRHWKRRFISLETLDRLARVLLPGATVRFASDIASYVEWTRVHTEAHPAFILAGDDPHPWDGWPGTRYEAKALNEGRKPRYLTLVRVEAAI